MNIEIIEIIDKILKLNDNEKIALFMSLGQILSEDENSKFIERIIEYMTEAHIYKPDEAFEDFIQVLSIVTERINIETQNISNLIN